VTILSSSADVDPTAVPPLQQQLPDFGDWTIRDFDCIRRMIAGGCRREHREPRVDS
jgi:hypothetical protein